MKQGTLPGLAWQELQELVKKGATEKTLTNPKIPFCVSDSSAPRGLQSHDWIIWLVLNAGRFLRMMSRHQRTSLMLWFLTWRGCFESLSGSLPDKHVLSHLAPASLSNPSSQACPGNSELFVVLVHYAKNPKILSVKVQIANILGYAGPKDSVSCKSCLYEKVKVLVAQLYLTLHNPMDCSLPGSSVHRIL